jgi:hypothetical protein
MRLIDEKEFEQASEKYSMEVWGAYYDNLYTDALSDLSYGEVAKNDFENGAKFAEQKLTPLFVEFAEWMSNCAKPITNLIGTRWKMYSYQSDKEYTTEQLFEQFLKTKQK